MDILEAPKEFVRDPMAWAADCWLQASQDMEPEAQAAFAQLASEFEAIATEIEGLISTFEALTSRPTRR